MSGAQSTEDTILSNIPDFQDDGNGADTSTQTDTTQGGGQSSAAPVANTTQVDAGGVTSGGTNNTTQQPATQPIVRRHDGLVEKPNAANPNTRDLVDPVTGQIVAQGGIERRVYETGARHARENTTLKQQLQTANAQLGAVNQVTQVARDLQIAPENQVVAMRVMSDFLKDPVKTLEYLVAEVKAKGYQIPFLTAGITPGMDLQAVGRMIDNKMAPLTAQQQQQQQQETARTNAKATLDTFLGTHPEAEHNLATMAEMITAQPGLSLSDAYVKLIGWATQNGLDYTQPLGPQIAARNGGQQQQQPTTQQPQLNQPQNQPQGNTRPLPQGRSAASGAAPVEGSKQFNENSTWGDIIRDSMRETGMQL